MGLSINLVTGLGLSGQAYVQPAECIIKIAGQPITDLYRFVTEVSVQATRSRFTEATITFYSPVDESGNWLVADDPRLETWAGVTIEADFQDATEEIMRGLILSIEPSFPTNAGEATVRLNLSRQLRAPRPRGSSPLLGRAAGRDDRPGHRGNAGERSRASGRSDVRAGPVQSRPEAEHHRRRVPAGPGDRQRLRADLPRRPDLFRSAAPDAAKPADDHGLCRPGRRTAARSLRTTAVSSAAWSPMRAATPTAIRALPSRWRRISR